MENKLILQVKYTCATCGIKIVDLALFNKKHNNVIEEKKLWHKCEDNYIVPLQSEVCNAESIN